MKSKRLFVLILLGLTIFSILLYFYTDNASAAKPIVLKAGSTWEENLLWNEGLRIFAKVVAEKSKGELTVKFVGGPETFPTFESTEMLRRGVIDILNTDATFYTKANPSVFTAIASEVSAEKEREVGYYDAMDKIHIKNLNCLFLGRMVDSQFTFVFKKPVDKPDFSGLKIRGLPFNLSLIKALGGSPIIVSPPELYSALEKGVVDGYGWPQVGHIERKFPEIAKYWIDHPYYRVSVFLLLNKNTYDRLPQHLQKLIKDVMPTVEKEARARHRDFVKSERAELAKLGVKFMTWKPADEKKFNDIANKVIGEEALRLSPNEAPALLKMIRKN